MPTASDLHNAMYMVQHSGKRPKCSNCPDYPPDLLFREEDNAKWLGAGPGRHFSVFSLGCPKCKQKLATTLVTVNKKKGEMNIVWLES